MATMICLRCGGKIPLAAGTTRCSNCGAPFPHDVQSVRYYYQHAAELAAGGDDAGALVVVHQGLRHYDAAELHLLAAILCRRLGRVDDLRRHIAAIPVDDSLRAEAEWLLRSQAAPVEMAGDPLPPYDPALEKLLQPPASAPAKLPRRKSRWLTLGLLLSALLFTWLITQLELLPRDVAQGLPNPSLTPEISATAGFDPTAAAAQETVAPAPAADEPAITPTRPARLLPTPTIAPNLVEAPPAPEPVAAARESGPTRSQSFDLAAYLTELGSAELAALDVAATLSGTEMALAGYVETFVQREQLIRLAELSVGTEIVNATDLYIRPPATYTVQAGDSLWSITYSVYGDMARMQDVYAANRDQMASPESLTTGMVLKLPPYDAP